MTTDKASSTSSPPPLGVGVTAAVAILLLVGAGLRILAARGDLWLDEIWSLEIARDADSALDLVFDHAIDNNHLLNTWLLRELGDRDYALILRLPGVLAGLVAVGVAAWWARRFGTEVVIFTTVLLSLSHPLIHYSSEARGYGLAVCFTMTALLSLATFLDRRSLVSSVAFVVSCWLGMLAHLLFLPAYAALLLWSFMRARELPERRSLMIGLVTRCHALPLVGLVFLYLLFVRDIRVGGGPPYSLPQVLADASALVLGAPRGGVAAGAAAAVVAALLGVGLWQLARRRNDLWVFFSVAVIGAPGLVLVVSQPKVLFERYFIIPLALLLVLTAVVLGSWYRRGGVTRVLSMVIVVSLVAGNSWQTVRLIVMGRGDYRVALTYIAAHSSNDPVVIAGDHDFRHGTVIDYHLRHLRLPRTLEYRGAFVMPRAGADWFLTHSFEPQPTPSDRCTDLYGNVYALEMRYTYAGLSGWHWFVYRRAAEPPLHDSH